MRKVISIVAVLFVPVLASAQTLESAFTDACQILEEESNLKINPDQRGEAAGLFQDRTKDGRIPNFQVRRVAQELAAIRAISPEAQAITPFAHGSYDKVSMDVSPALAAKLGPRLSKKGRKINFPCSTGSRELDKALASLSCKSVEVESFGDSYGMTVTFSQPVDLRGAENRLSGVGLEGTSGGLVRIGSPRQSINRFEKNGDSLYALGDAGANADCMAGCLQEYIYFKVSWGQNGPEAKAVTPARPWMSVYGYPDRFPARPFYDYSDLMNALSDADWSVRLHAVNTLKRILNYGSTGVGEDDMPGSPQEAARIKAIFKAVRDNADEVKKRLEVVATTDRDPDVQAAAKKF